MGGEDHGSTTLMQMLQGLEQMHLGMMVQAGGGLIQHHQLGLHRQDAGNGHALLLSKTQLLNGAIPQPLNVQRLEGLLDPHPCFIRGEALIQGAERDILKHRRRKELTLGLLQDQSHLGSPRPQRLAGIGHRLTLTLDGPPLGSQGPIEVQQQGGLARAVGA